VGDFAGDSNFVDATNPASIVNDPTAIEGYGVNETGATALNPGATEIEGYGVPEQGAFTPPSTLEQLQAKASDALTSAQDAIKKQLAQITPEKISKTVEGYAKQFVGQTAKQVIAQNVPPALQPYATRSLNAAVNSVKAGPVTDPSNPGFVGPPAPATTTASAAPSTTKADGESVGNIYDDGFGGFVNGDGQPVDANGSLIPTGTGPANPNNDPSAIASSQRTTNVPAGQVDRSAGNVGYTTGQDPENGTYYVKNEQTGQIVATGLTQQQAILQAQDQTFVDAGDSPTSNVTQIIKTNTPGTVNDPSLATPPLSTAEALAAAASLIPGGTAVTTAIADAAARAQGLLRQAQNQQTARVQSNTNAATGDWRVRLQLANASDYLYNAPDCGPLLWPLRDTDGVIFPYTPTIDTAYRANYSQYDLTHSNYRGYFYQNSYIDGINIKATFTAQDTVEANYMLACIHFFRSVTKMFYGQDAQRGTPPPLVFLSGLGDFQFNRHPCLVSQFNYNLPADVNYIRAQSTVVNGGNQLAARTRQTTLGNPISSTIQRLSSLGQKIFPGAVTAPFAPQGSLAAGNPTYVPTKMEMSLVLLPVQTRSQVSQQFSLRGFANGNLLKGGFW